MWWKRRRKMSSDEGVDAIMSLMGNISQAAATGRIDEFDPVFDRLQEIVDRTKADLPGMAERIATLRSKVTDLRRQNEDIDAAMWVGDLERAKGLMAEQELMLSFELDDPEFNADEEEHHVQKPADPYEDIANGVHGAIDRLIESGADVNAWGGPVPHTPLLAALDAPARNVDDIRKLVEAGADPMVAHFGGDNAVSWAMGYHHQDTVTRDSEIELISYLVDQGVPANSKIDGQWSTLHRAIIQGGPNQLAAYLAAGGPPDIDTDPRLEPARIAAVTAVMLACAKPESLRMLLDAGASPSRLARDGRNAMEFVTSMLDAARAREREDDPWTIAHADALMQSREMLGAFERQ